MRTLRRGTQILIALPLALLAAGLSSVAVLAADFPCLKASAFPSFQLSESDACRASIRVQDGTLHDAKICLNRGQWENWLTSQSPQALCGQLEGHWKLGAPLSEETLTEPKAVSPSFRLQALPQTSRQVSPLWQRLQSFRESISIRLKPWDEWGVMRALVLGETNAASPHAFLRIIGFFHLLNASGVHLYALALVTSAACAFLLEKAQISAGFAIGASRALSILFCAWAWALCGCRPGMLRPAFVGGSRFLASSLGFRWRYWAPFVLSFLLELFLAWSHHQSFLSESRMEIALSVGGFLMAVQDRHPASDSSTSQTFVGMFVQLIGGWIFVALAQAFQNHLIPLSAPILSALTVPLFCTLVYPWILIESLCCSQAFLGNLLLSFTQRFLHSLVALSLALPSLWMISSKSLILSLVLSLIVVSFSFRLKPIKRTIIALAAFVALLSVRTLPLGAQASISYAQFPPQRAAREVVQLDVGQGDGALVLSRDEHRFNSTAGRAGLIDAGSARSLNDAQWIEAFARNGVSELDWVALTHLDEDHRGGLDRLTRLLPIRCVTSSEQEISSPRGVKLARQLLSQGTPLQSWEAGCVPFPTYYPKDLAKTKKHQKKSGNLSMSALLIPLESGDTYLSAGDAEGGDEIAIFKWANERTPRSGLRILKVSHHGSKTSSATQALKAFHPDFAIISVGLGNTYGHPSQEVLDRFSVMKIPVFRTDQFGAIRAEAFLHPQQAHRP